MGYIYSAVWEAWAKKETVIVLYFSKAQPISCSNNYVDAINAKTSPIGIVISANFALALWPIRRLLNKFPSFLLAAQLGKIQGLPGKIFITTPIYLTQWLKQDISGTPIGFSYCSKTLQEELDRFAKNRRLTMFTGVLFELTALNC